MPKTAVGSFENAALADDVVRELEALGFPRQEVRTVQEPKTFEVTGTMSFPRLDYEVELGRELIRIGASKDEAEGYLAGLRRGRALVFATGSEENVDAAAKIMNLRGGADVETATGGTPNLPSPVYQGMSATSDSPVQAGRIREPGEGAQFFVW